MAERLEPTPALRRAVFVDRDGTLLQRRAYISDPEEVELIPGVPRALRELRDAGLALLVITNQSGIAKGLYTGKQYETVARRLNRILEEEGAAVDGTYHCPHHPDHTGRCGCRKPALGMHLQAAREHEVSLQDSYFIGDKVKDVVPAGKVGGTGILVRTGFGPEQTDELPSGMEIAEDLPEAARMILAREAGSG